MIKKIFSVLAMVIGLVGGLSMEANATLINRGKDTLGNRLIYDTDLNITWYDYTRYDLPPSPMGYDNQLKWADALSVTFKGKVYDDWRLPSAGGVPEYDLLGFTYGYDGTTDAGYNITSSEMGYLFYTELRNKGQYDTSGNRTRSRWGLVRTGPFRNLQPADYWYGNRFEGLISPAGAWFFSFDYGYQGVTPTCRDTGCGSETISIPGTGALAVRPGDVSTVPEPATLLLLGSGLAGMVGWRRVRRRKKV